MQELVAMTRLKVLLCVVGGILPAAVAGGLCFLTRRHGILLDSDPRFHRLAKR
jgi:hypothetical protein